jgi:hypothetical protein
MGQNQASGRAKWQQAVLPLLVLLALSGAAFGAGRRLPALTLIGQSLNARPATRSVPAIAARSPPVPAAP